MKKTFKKILPVLLLLVVYLLARGFGLFGEGTEPALVEAPQDGGVSAVTELPAPDVQDAASLIDHAQAPPHDDGNTSLDPDGSYDTLEDVALYLQTYGELPHNYMTKDEARAQGWQGGPLWKILPGMCIGGDRFGNREGQLPSAAGRIWYECDINTLSKDERGAERLLYSSDGLIYYTADHYDSFTLISDGK